MREQIRDWLDKLRQGTLVEDDLQAALDRPPRQTRFNFADPAGGVRALERFVA